MSLRDPSYSNGTLVVSNRYDHLGRRVQKIAADGTHTFLYDGWRPVVETVERIGGGIDRIEYHWGKDLSGSLDGAAGVGGLLYVKRSGAIYVLFDGNGLEGRAGGRTSESPKRRTKSRQNAERLTKRN